jgi:hypothetical protein
VCSSETRDGGDRLRALAGCRVCAPARVSGLGWRGVEPRGFGMGHRLLDLERDGRKMGRTQAGCRWRGPGAPAASGAARRSADRG